MERVIDMPEEKVEVKVSVCQKCGGIIRAAVAHMMTTKSKNEFMREVMKYDLSVKTIPLLEYRQNKPEWCKCLSPELLTQLNNK